MLSEGLKNHKEFIKRKLTLLRRKPANEFKRKCLSESIELHGKAIQHLRNPRIKRSKIEALISRAILLAAVGGAYDEE